ncbi:radical SAM protein [Candidatus Sumerlaeota bacterium]|nr:radical SAM protein [Candidatus Sumerlaeota bacterium]
MPSPLRSLKDSTPVLKGLLFNACRLLRKARAEGRPEILTRARTLYALERRVLDYLDRKQVWGLDDSTPAPVREGFDLLCETFLHLRDAPDRGIAHGANRRLNALEKKAKIERLRSYPVRLGIEITNQCNLRCPMCGQAGEKGPRFFLSLDDIATHEPVFEWLDEMHIYGYGEALLVDYIPELLALIPPHVRSVIVTNGTLLTRETCRMLVDRGLKTLTVSVDAADRALYRELRGVDKLDEVLDSIRYLIEYRRSKGLAFPDLTFNVVAMKKNVDEMPALVRLAAELGVDRICIAYMMVFYESLRGESLFYDQERADRRMDEAEALGRDLGVQVFAPPRFRSGTGRAAHFDRCYEPWEIVWLRCDGKTSPCCGFPDPLGAWRGVDFWNFWNSPGFTRLRRTLETDQESHWCRDCANPYYMDVRLESSHITNPALRTIASREADAAR